nr:PREDICTED: opsin-5-like isoform X1 [Lepisosteus oculatus]XP_015199493.1 PREDICTED: opsin-5-like isoform X1 [Lepisosteus oculatus]XP_015199497.1 PREDICTED: opsin-5-like isoform X1 [Lepisosteus oculatus]
MWSSEMDDKYTSKLSPALDYGAGTFLIVIAVLSILGNGAVLATAVKRSSVLKAAELLSVNLALTDIGMALSMYPLSIASAFNHAWVGGDPSCIYYGLMGFFFSVASIMTLATMAVVRYLITRTPRTSGNRFDKKKIYFVILFIWLYAALWALLPVLGWGHYGPEPFGLSCSVDWAGYHNSVNGATFLLSMFVLCTVFPCLAIVLCYSGIAWKLHKAYQAIQNSEHLPKSSNLEKKFTLMAVLISTGFIVCWTPYVVVSFLTTFQSKDSLTPVASLLPCLFAKSSTAYNPLIYYVFSRSFRRELKKMKCCGFRVHLSTADISALSHFTVGGNLRDDAKSASAIKRHQ